MTHLATKKKMNRYFLSIPVTDDKEARSLGSRTNWEIIEALRDAGSNGLTAKEMIRELDISKNTVYNAIRFLEGPSEDSAWVSSRRPPKHPGKKNTKDRFREVINDEAKKERIELAGTATRIYVEEVPWGRAIVDEDFKDIISPVLEKAVAELKEKYLDVIEKAIEAVKKEEEGKFFPNHDDRPCPECGIKHEALEFVEAISYCLHEELFDSIGDEVFPKHGFGRPLPEE